MLCEIQWVNEQGEPTPDRNQAIGRVRMKAHTVIIGERRVDQEQSRWFPICREHAERLRDPGMENWQFEGGTWEFAPLGQIHHPGKDRTGHPVSECAARGCRA